MNAPEIILSGTPGSALQSRCLDQFEVLPIEVAFFEGESFTVELAPEAVLELESQVGLRRWFDLAPEGLGAMQESRWNE
ncbi:MAG: hypothetical protein JWR19_1456 [Pedosphaera sp.]|jgi:hypothetical protein|nr:hypothetical protein [Pedosphaera sp.]